ncbi:scavenger receptor cysteine-rich type 1 protein M130-like isoform X2 [Parambassis ranga]|uniref:Scavenger receptor cysteine-rich type 1 protein M130-like isoform X2 n=1 Tax=Parambassis ranga TaxID=210632 RepID=A0A6P7JE79_9TELE|nr:scavenger receptor cysteine-rich type 1 protein M130-like isoform X2 [Parambassis ranga]
MTGNALNYVFKNSFTEEAGARTGFPKVLVIITDGESNDAVEGYARLLRKMGVKIFVVAINDASKEEIQLMASTPHSSHIVWMDHIDKSHNEERNLITLVCTCVDEQLNILISREVVEPASNLQVLEVASKSMRLTWDASIGDISAYKVQLIPRMADSKLQDLYVGPTQTTVMVRDLAPDTEYQISLFALKRLTPSEPVTAMQKTEPVQVSLECSLDVDVKADVVLFVDGSYSIGLAKVRAFLEVLVNTFNIGPDKVQISLIQNCMDPHAEFYLNTHHDLNAVVKAVRTFSYRGGSTNASKALNHVREKIFQSSRGSRPNVPRVIILITDGQLSDDFEDPATRLRNADVDIFAVGVKDAVRSELEAIATEPVETHVFTVEDFDGFHRISKELTQSICHNIYQRQLLQPKTLSFSEVSTRSFRASWEIDVNMVESFLVRFEPADDADSHYMSMSVPGDTLTALLPQLTPMTRYKVNIYAQYEKGDSLPVTGHETTLKGLCADNTQSPTETDEVRLVGGASRCAGRLEVKEGEEWRAEWFSERDLKAATAVCRQLDCGSVLSIEAGSYPYKVQIHCSESVRLVEGINVCSGRLEVKSDQSWSSVCEDDFNLQNAEVVCRELGCGAPSVFKGGLYGAAEAPVWMRRFQCGGHESALLDCGSSQSTENSCSAGKAVGLTCSDPGDLRLVGGANRCSGRLELKHNAEWREVYISYSDWPLKKAAVVCQWLDCGSPVSTSFRDLSSMQPMWNIITSCFKYGSITKECVRGSDMSSKILEMSCSDSVRLVEGTNVCSGRLEVKSDQSWSSVCEDDFNLQNAEVVCRELNCGAPSVFKGGLYGAAEAPVWMRRFQCRGHESALLDCGSSQSTENSCSAGKAVGLTCSDHVNVQLVGGVNRCSGTLEVKHNGEWREAASTYTDWTLKDAAIVCQWLDCGSPVSTSFRDHSLMRPVWNMISSCFKYGSMIKECVQGSDMSSEILEMSCSDSVRLVEGTNMCSGRLEVKSDQSWSSVCEDDFNLQNAEVVCRELGCGAPSVFKGGLYGAAEAPVWMRRFQCGGHESALLDCGSSQSTENSCSAGKAVGLTCSDPDDVRLVGGANRCSGRLELKHNGEWREVDISYSEWTLKQTAVMCRRLVCFSPFSASKRDYFTGRPVWKIRSSCIQHKSMMKECVLKDSFSSSSLEITCMELLTRPNVSLSPSTDGVSQAEQQGFWVLIGSTFGIMCSIEPQYQGGSFQLMFTSSNTAQNYTLPAVNHSAIFLFSAADHTHRGTYTCVYHNHVWSRDFSSVSQPRSLAVLAPLTELIIRVTVVLLAMTSSITAICCYYKPKLD